MEIIVIQLYDRDRNLCVYLCKTIEIFDLEDFEISFELVSSRDYPLRLHLPFQFINSERGPQLPLGANRAMPPMGHFPSKTRSSNINFPQGYPLLIVWL